MMKKKQWKVLFLIFITFLLILLLGPMDVFRHGYYCDVVEYDEISSEDRLGYADLQNGAYELKFSPVKKYFTGFEINLINQPKGNKGKLKFSIYNSNGKQVDEIRADLKQISATKWYKLYANKTLKKGEIYTLKISAEECATVPYLQLVDSDCLGKENISGNVLLGYAYAESTFDFQNKILIIMFLIALCGLICVRILDHNKHAIIVGRVAVFVLLTSVLTWNFMYNSMDNDNNDFEDFQSDSESLVTAVLAADHAHVGLREGELGYGLGVHYYNIKDNFHDKENLKSDENWNNGYSCSSVSICIDSNIYTKQIAMVGNSVQFANGSMFQIINVSDDGDCISIDLNAERMLTESKYGELTEVIFYDQNMVQLPNGILTAYPSQYGLQGKIFKHLARHMEYEGAAENLKLICSMAAAVVFVLIVFLLSKRYNRVLGGVFFVTFLLSPWIVNFASNLYWVEFTWFLPMVIGLFCAWKVDNKYCRIFSYVAAFVAVTVKCLCGYEYITSVMMGLILFLLSDFVMACIKGDRKQQFLLFRTIFILGILALAGFITAICIHAPLRGNGSIAKGIKSIFIDDVLRRTTGADLNHYTEDYVVALGASVWETVCKYFHFNTQIITGIDGNLFPLLCIIPVLIFIIGLRRNSLDFEFVALYIVTFLTSVSWFVLAKSHSYVHTHINFVLWYMGYVQVCLYVIVDWIIDRIGVRREYYE